jgi:WD40 repeat protein
MNNDRIQKAMLISCIVLGVSLVCFLWMWSFPLVYLALQIYTPIHWEKKGGWRLMALLPLLVGVPALVGLVWMVIAAAQGIIHRDGLWSAIALLPYMALGFILLYYFILFLVRYSSRKSRLWAEWAEVLEDVKNPAILAFFKEEILSGQDHNWDKRYLSYGAGPNELWFLVARPRNVFALQQSRFQGDLEFWRGALSHPDEIKVVKNGSCLRFLLATKEDFRFFREAANEKLIGAKWLGSAEPLPLTVGQQRHTRMALLPGALIGLIFCWGLLAFLYYWIEGRFAAIVTLNGHGGEVYCVAYSPDGRWIASASKDRTAKVWDAGTGKEILTLAGHGDEVRCVAFSPDGKLIVTGSQDKNIKIWDIATGQELVTFKGHTSTVTTVTYSPNGKWIASASGDPSLKRAGEVKVWDATTGRSILTFQEHTESGVESLCFSHDGTHIATTNSGVFKVWDAKTGQEILTSRGGHRGGITSIAYSHDDRRILSGSRDTTLKLWDAKTGQEKLSLSGHNHLVSSAALSPDGNWIASGSWDMNVKIWNAENGQEIRTLRGHSRWINSVAFSSDGKHIASGGADTTIKIWKVPTP